MENERILRYIYEIKNLINGKTYIGQRTVPKGKKLTEDNYFGSGILITRAEQKYGIENFEKTIILKGNFTKKEINRFEVCMIASQRLIGKAEYNIAKGGEGWSDEMKASHWKSTHTKKFREMASQHAREGNLARSEELSKLCKRLHQEGKFKGTLGYKFTEAQKKNISESVKGEVNGAYGTHWYTNGVISIRAKECPEGFHPGRIEKKK